MRDFLKLFAKSSKLALSRTPPPTPYPVESELERKATGTRLDLSRLRARAGEKPRTKFGQIRQAWPEIKILIAAGHSLKDICTWLNEIGVEIGYGRLSDYLSQLKRAEHAPPTAKRRSPTEPVPVPLTPAAGEPLTNLREREEQRPGFHYNSEPDPKKLI